ncbi:hypothetical protein [Streptosporangium sp. H16]|uniref:hypothetical protein n=1 Tax=Streptosporangium sp. H16 TaxID=3444184 RepID=UPI003F7A55E8
MGSPDVTGEDQVSSRPWPSDLVDELDRSSWRLAGRTTGAGRAGRIRHEITVSAVSPRWFGEFLLALHDAVENLRFDEGRLRRDAPGGKEVRLVEGRHLGRGARYRLESGGRTNAEVVVRSWGRVTETCADIIGSDGSDGSGDVACRLRLRSAAEPEVAGVEGILRVAGDDRGLLRFSWRAQVDFERWWAHAYGRARRRTSAPLSGTITHRFALATFSAVPEETGAGDWRVVVNMRVRGRSWFRPLAAVALPFGLERFFLRTLAETLDEMAMEWNDGVARVLRRDPRRAAESFFAGP